MKKSPWLFRDALSVSQAVASKVRMLLASGLSIVIVLLVFVLLVVWFFVKDDADDTECRVRSGDGMIKKLTVWWMRKRLAWIERQQVKLSSRRHALKATKTRLLNQLETDL